MLFQRSLSNYNRNVFLKVLGVRTGPVSMTGCAEVANAICLPWFLLLSFTIHLQGFCRFPCGAFVGFMVPSEADMDDLFVFSLSTDALMIQVLCLIAVLHFSVDPTL